jgi:hypothetical protein
MQAKSTRNNPNAKAYNYQYNAKRRGLDFDMEVEEAISHFYNDCAYCAKPVKPGEGLHGMDGVNHTVGYDVETWSQHVGRAIG